MNSEEQRRKLVTQLYQLRAHPGWKIVLSNLQNWREAKEHAIFQLGGNESKYSAKDLLIIERDYITMLMSLPDKLIEDAEAPDQRTDPNDDPFADN